MNNKESAEESYKETSNRNFDEKVSNIRSQLTNFYFLRKYRREEFLNLN